jgi:HAMP domain-containing protein
LAAALALAPLIPAPGQADELADFHAALERALDQYHFAMSVLETGSQEQTAAEVGRLRQVWQAIAERFGAQRPAAFDNDDNYRGIFMQNDLGLVGVLLIIDHGNRDAALVAIGDSLTQLAARSAPPR